ncbi:MAG: ATP-dependent helicase RecG [Bacteroidota bacterium]
MSFFDTKIEFLKGVGPQRGATLQTELRIFTYADLLQHYPFRYDDRSKIYSIAELHEHLPYVQVRGKLVHFGVVGEGGKKRMVAYVQDATGELELVWFRNAIKYVEKQLKIGEEYIVFGKPNLYNNSINVTHPEMDTIEEASRKISTLQPVYSSTEKLKNIGLDSKGISKLIYTLLQQLKEPIPETIPQYIMQRHGLIPKTTAVQLIHFPTNTDRLEQARYRLKFEELFYVQIRLISLKVNRKNSFAGHIFRTIPLVNEFYKHHLPFTLTDAQKKVIREIYSDMSSGKQMNRLLQGDVGSGKTMVAFICMLMAVDNNAQACLMAPTEILADQHLAGLKPYADALGINIAKLSGSSKKSERTRIHEQLLNGTLHLLVGTHALLEDVVQFKNLGLCIIDEQHRFGVAQRAKMWAKNKALPPHVLVMTATPIPRTLAMTLYGDLDLSVIDQMPAGRKPIQTVHRKDANRLAVFGFMRQEIQKGRQVYVVYPLIEENDKMALKDLMDGYESISRSFPDYQLSIVHGKMKAADKDYEMQRFIKKETQIMVATTVIEVGVNVPNASVMVIENAERFGLAQLHQLRGRVGRGAEQSYCILMTKDYLSTDGKVRISTMCETTNGFEIADVDLKLRGPGDLMGTQQSGILDLLITDLATDGDILKQARADAEELLLMDNTLSYPQHICIKQQIARQQQNSTNWARIS